MDFVFAGLGLVILILAGDALVKGAANLSLRIGIPALIVSLTIVAFGTSAPELLIALSALFEGAPGLALGNVVGSNIANVLLVLGLPALLSGLNTAKCDTKRSYYQMLAATALFVAACLLGPITWMHAIVLLAAFGWMLWDAISAARRHRRRTVVAGGSPDASPQVVNLDDEEEVEGADPTMSKYKIAMFLGLGLIGLPLGADLLVDSSVDIARDYGISEEIIGLTLVAFGTSLPELATTVMAALRKQAEIAIGNVIGSNMFNLLGIIGVTGLFGTLRIPREFLIYDIWIMVAAALVLVPFVVWKWNMSRFVGLILTGLYLAYVVTLLG